MVVLVVFHKTYSLHMFMLHTVVDQVYPQAHLPVSIAFVGMLGATEMGHVHWCVSVHVQLSHHFKALTCNPECLNAET